MLAHHQRVIDEKAELDLRLCRLKDLIDGPAQSSSVEEQDRLNRQLDYMHAYSGVLGERIETF